MYTAPEVIKLALPLVPPEVVSIARVVNGEVVVLPETITLFAVNEVAPVPPFPTPTVLNVTSCVVVFSDRGEANVL